MAWTTAQAELVADWTADTYVEGQNWTSNTGGIVATLAGFGTPLAIPGAFHTHQGIELDGASYFTVEEADNPLGNATAMTLLAVFEPLGTGAAGGSWWESSGLIGMERGGSVGDWGLGWNNDRISAGTGGPDITMFSKSRGIPEPQIAMLTWDGNVQRLYVNGVLVDSDYFVSPLPRVAGKFALGAMTENGNTPFFGRIAELRMYDSDESANAATLYNTLRAAYFAPLELASSSLTTTGGTFVVKDTPGSTAAAPTPEAYRIFLNAVEVPSGDISVNQAGGQTTVTFTSTQTLNTAYNFELTVPRTANGEQTFFGTVNTPRLPATLPGIAGSLGTWGISESAGNPGDIAGALGILTGPTPPVPTTGTAPVFNHRDPDTNNVTAIGNFNNDLPILTNAAGDQQFVVTGKTQVSIPGAGLYTFSVHSDDGFAMRITGAGGGRFVSTGGDGQIDLGDSRTLYRDGGTGDSNSRGVYQFDAAGSYDIEYLGWDGGGGGYYEVAWAPGGFSHDRDTNTWSLVGTPSDPGVPPYQERHLLDLPGPSGTNGSFGARVYRDSGDLGSTWAASNFLSTTARVPGDGITVDAQMPYMNHRDPNDGGGGVIPGDLPFPGDTNVAEDRVVTSAKGRINITTAGPYTFWAQGDDGFMLRIKGTNGNPDPVFHRATQGDNNGGDGKFEMSNLNEIFFNGGTGNSNTRGIINLAAGAYDIDYIHLEQTGGYFHELTAAAGEWPHGTTPPNGFQLVGFAPPSTTVSVPGIAEPGWTVETGEVGFYDNNIAGAEQRINDTLADPTAPAEKTSVWDKIDFYDPQDGSQNVYTGTNPWPLDGPVAENDFSIRATGIVNITEAGTYHFGFQGDDGGYLYIYGHNGTTDPTIGSILTTNLPAFAQIGQAPGSTVNNAVRVDTPTGNSRTIVSVPLNVGQYRIQTLVFEVGGGFYWEVYGAKGPLDPGTVLPLLVKGPGSTVNLTSGLALVQQGTTPDPGFQIVNATITKGPPTTAQFSFGSQDGASYSIEASPDLSNWTTVLANVTGTGTSTPVSVDLSAFPALNGQAKVFLRVREN